MANTNIKKALGLKERLMNHDEIQMYLLIEKNRTAILKKLRIKFKGRNSWLWASIAKQEERFKPDYQPELFVDLLEKRTIPSRKSFEIKFIEFIRTQKSSKYPSKNEPEWSDFYEPDVCYKVGKSFSELGWAWQPKDVAFCYNQKEETLYNHIYEYFLLRKWVIDKTDSLEFTIVWEIKPVLSDLGATLRQMQKYKDIVKPNILILIYAHSEFPDKEIQAYFNNQGIWTYKISKSSNYQLTEFNNGEETWINEDAINANEKSKAFAEG